MMTIVESSIWTPIFYALGILVSVGAYSMWYGRRSEVRRKSAHAVAFARLDEARSLLRKSRARLFSYAVTSAIGKYLERRFDIRLKHETTEDFLGSIADGWAEAEAFEDHIDAIADFIGHCDQASLSRYFLSLDQMREMYESARYLVASTCTDVTSQDDQGEEMATRREREAESSKGPHPTMRFSATVLVFVVIGLARPAFALDDGYARQHPTEGRHVASLRPIIERPWFLALQAIPITCFVAGLVLMLRNRRRPVDSVSYRTGKIFARRF